MKFVKVGTFKTTITPNMPGQADNGGAFEVELRYYEQPDYMDLTSRRLDDRAFVDEVLVGVSGITDEAGQQYPPELQRQIVLNNMPIIKAVGEKFLASHTGAAEKNSNPSRGR